LKKYQIIAFFKMFLDDFDLLMLKKIKKFILMFFQVKNIFEKHYVSQFKTRTK